MNERIKSANINLRDEIASIIQKEDYFFDIFVTITEAEISKDLKNLKIFISVMPEDKLGTVLRILRSHAYEINKKLLKRVKIKNIPKLSFLLDEGYKNYKKIENIINKENENK